MENSHEYKPCLSGRCSYQLAGENLECFEGDGDCGTAVFLEAEESIFHDSALIEATKTIKEALEKARNSPTANGRQLSLLQTNMGVLLAWVEHNHETEKIVTSKSDDANIIQAFKLKIDSPNQQTN